MAWAIILPMNAMVWATGVLFLAVACGGESESDGSGGTSGSGGAGGSGGAAGGAPGGAGGSGGSVGGSGGSGGGGGAGGSAGAGGAAGSVGVDCNPSTVSCKAMQPVCPKGQVPAVENGCWGPCVPVLTCKPEKDCSTCTNGWCAAYVSFGTEYRCVSPSIQCAALACSCLADYFCASPFDACTTPGGGATKVSCECPTC